MYGFETSQSLVYCNTKIVLSSDDMFKVHVVPEKEYRPDLQIARAIAVISVFLFHLNVPFFSGGFVGVDIFFVLSGYFIARTLLASGEDVKLPHIFSFYNRRIRRILPLALFVCLTVIVASAFILPSVELKELVKQTLASAFGFSNLLFSHDRSYFQQTLFRPLLHFWSLAVEFQYYLLFPILFLFIQKSRALGLVFWFASFVLCVVITYDSPRTAFFWMPMRIWEFLLGYYALIAEPKFQIKDTYKRIGSVGALIAICLSVIFYNEKMLFPGWLAFLPTFSTFILIVCGLPKPRATFHLPYDSLVWIGTLSFSIYLWHYPVLWLFTYQPFIYGASPSFLQIIAIIMITLSLSLFSYKYIEEPYRSVRTFPNKKFYVSILFAYLILGAVSFYCRENDYIVRTYNDVQKVAIAGVEDRPPYRCEDGNVERGYNSCLLGGHLKHSKKKFLLAGNSHADSIKPPFISRAEDKGVAFYLMNDSNNPDLGKFNAEYFVKEIESRKITDFIFHGLLTSDHTYPELEKIINYSIKSNVMVHIVDPTPVFEVGVPTDFYKHANKANLSGPEYDEQNKEYFEWKKKIEKKYSAVRFYETKPILCPDKCIVEKDNKLLYFDAHHLTIAGAMLLAPLVDNIYDH